VCAQLPLAPSGTTHRVSSDATCTSPESEAIRKAWPVHTSGGSARAAVAPRATKPIKSPRAAPRHRSPSPYSRISLPGPVLHAATAPSSRLRRRRRDRLLLVAGACRQCRGGGRGCAAKALQDPGNGRLTERLTDLLHHVSARHRR
jgi:hypothetical protein